jgi:predicted O-methyltransferase YrrM
MGAGRIVNEKLQEMVNTFLRSAALRVPPVGRLYHFAMQTAEENRRLAEENRNLRRGLLESEALVRQEPTAPDPMSIEQLAAAFAGRIQDQQGNPFHALFQAAGYHLLRKHFYVPLPELADIRPEDWTTPSKLTGVDMNEATAHELMDRILPPFLAEFRARFPIEATPGREGFHLINGSYMAVDAHLLYGLVRHYKPRRIVEIGNGASTMLAVAAVELNRAEGYPTNVVSVDPYPSAAFKNGYTGLDELIIKPVQDVPQSLFESLDRNDILFIDSSHVLRWGNDVDHLYLNILPLLRVGVLIHVHDVSLPMPYPKVYFDSQLYWNEQYLLQAFLIFNSRFKIIWPGNHMMLREPEKMLAVFPEIADMRAVYPSGEPTAFWMQVSGGS